jgi:Holliday junction resolvase RusA-like endonuclease
MIKLTIPGIPISKKRPRFARVGKGVRTYSNQHLDMARYRWCIKEQIKGKKLLTGAIHLEITFFMPIPKAISKKKKLAMQIREIWHTKRPDLDNLEKFVSDCLNSLAWKDDSQIVTSITHKIYDDNPRTEIMIEELTDERNL